MYLISDARTAMTLGLMPFLKRSATASLSPAAHASTSALAPFLSFRNVCNFITSLLQGGSILVCLPQGLLIKH